MMSLISIRDRMYVRVGVCNPIQSGSVVAEGKGCDCDRWRGYHH